MFYQITNRKQGPVQLALRSLDGKKTKSIVLPWKATFKISEEQFSDQINNLAERGDIKLEKITKK